MPLSSSSSYSKISGGLCPKSFISFSLSLSLSLNNGSFASNFLSLEPVPDESSLSVDEEDRDGGRTIIALWSALFTSFTGLFPQRGSLAT